MQFCVSFIAPWLRNGSFQRPQSFQFLNRSLFRSSSVVVNLRWRLNEYCQNNKWHRWDICEEFSVWHFVTKNTDLNSVKHGISSHFYESRDPSCVSSAMCRMSRENWRILRATVYTHEKAGQRSSKDKVAWLHLRAFLFPFWCGASRRSEIAVDCEVFRILLPTRLSPKENRARKWMN